MLTEEDETYSSKQHYVASAGLWAQFTVVVEDDQLAEEHHVV